jgi:hypothetical protein
MLAGGIWGDMLRSAVLVDDCDPSGHAVGCCMGSCSKRRRNSTGEVQQVSSGLLCSMSKGSCGVVCVWISAG